MKTMNELRAQQKAERKTVRATEALLKLLPIAPKSVCLHSDSASVNYSKPYPGRHTLAEAITILNAYRPFIVTSEHWNDGCISCRPLAINGSAKCESSKLVGTSAVELELGAGRGYDSHEITFWAKIGETLVSVGIELRPEWKWLPLCKFRYDQHGDVTTNQVSALGIGEDSQRKWWSSPGSYKISYYWADLYNWDSWASHELAEAQKTK